MSSGGGKSAYVFQFSWLRIPVGRKGITATSDVSSFLASRAVKLPKRQNHS